jgi:hypothetical protein
MPATKLGALLDSGINALMPHAERVIELRRILNDLLPENLRRSCSIANFAQGKVVIFADNAAIAAKLNLLAPDLCRTMAIRRGEVTAIEVRVQPKVAHGSASNRLQVRRDLSDKAAESLHRLADKLHDSELKKTVRRLAKRNVGKR